MTSHLLLCPRNITSYYLFSIYVSCAA